MNILINIYCCEHMGLSTEDLCEKANSCEKGNSSDEGEGYLITNLRRATHVRRVTHVISEKGLPSEELEG